MASRTASITSILPLLLLLFVPSSSSLVKFDLKGSVHPHGHIYANIEVGEPAREYSLDIDTGSTLTWLQCHDPNCRGQCRKVLRTVHRSLIREYQDNALNLCWKGPRKFTSIFEVKPLFNPIFLVFGKGSQRRIMEIPPENYLIISIYGNVCFGILPLPKEWKNSMILGAITMQDRIVIYDNEGKSRVGWAHHSC